MLGKGLLSFNRKNSVQSLNRAARRMASVNGLKRWPFAPLAPTATQAARNGRPKLEGVVFDVDGTLCEPQNYMFSEMRQALGIPKSVDILDHVHSLPEGEQVQAFDKIKTIEREAMRLQKPQPGLLKLMEYLESRGVRKAICTRNFDEPVQHLLTTFVPEQLFSPIITRSFRPPKPDPAGILHIAESWSVPSSDRAVNLIMVGDSLDDMRAGSRAGATTVLLRSAANEHLSNHDSTSLCIDSLEDLISILDTGSYQAR